MSYIYIYNYLFIFPGACQNPISLESHKTCENVVQHEKIENGTGMHADGVQLRNRKMK